ncbi:sigma-70 family RNA polymerase sigma factor [Agathobaculum hominis]|uniref:Sigma-70 family RNA polymerase sigma factor n=1 Tax=Agathobaculum hominis TaxID=2763014 RepID=A0ABR7GK09_9FIRM|nr:sigma-70 family RNA polymerase sigma factor [Agathobaculum hominis]
MDLQELILHAANHSEAETLEVIKRFKPLLKKYARLLHIEDAYDELQAEFLKIIYSTHWSNLHLQTEGAYVGYIATAVRNMYINLSKSKERQKECCFSSFGEEQEFMLNATLAADDNYDRLLFKDLRRLLTRSEFRVVYLACFKGYSCAAIAKKQGVSRQHINQVKRRALGKLKQYFQANSDEQE